MQNPSVQSSGRRFFKRVGFALLQTAIFGTLIGLLASLRLPRTQLESEGAPQTVLAYLVELLERGERIAYDARVRALGESLQRQRPKESKPKDRVVVATVDDDTLGNARQSEHPGLASYPWPRELIGKMTGRLVTEGASVVLLDMPFPELSPRGCGFEPGAEQAPDDAAFRAQLEQSGVSGRSGLSFSWSVPRASPPTVQLWPFRVRVGTYAGQPEARAQAQRVLAAQRPAFLISEGDKVEVWAGVEDEREGQLLAARLGSGLAPVRERRNADDASRFTALDLFVSLAEVEVEGLDPAKLLQVRTLQPPVVQLLGAQSLYGAATDFPDPDGTVRGQLHLVSYAPREGEHHVLPSLPLAAAMKLQGERKLRYADGRLYVGKLSIPMDETGYSLTLWDTGDVGRTAGATVFRSLRAWNILVNLFDAEEGRPARSVNDLEQRAVILTNTSRYSTDFKATPVGKATPGGSLMAQSLENLLQSQGITRVPSRRDLQATMGMAFLGAAIAFFFSRSFRSGVGALIYFCSAVVLGVGYFLVARYFFVEQQLWVAVAGPLLAMLATFLFTTIYMVRTEDEIRDFVNHALGRYVSPEVARLVTKDLTLLVRPERRQMTMFFSDIAGFTRLAEQMEPALLVQLLNEYLTEMTLAVRSSGGQVDKYIGDTVMAFWGAPLRTERHAHLACEAALKMRATLQERQPQWEKKYGQRIQFRAGLNSGQVVVGDMGTELKSNYTVFGDAVGVASWLEGCNKFYGTVVLVGESTAQLTRDAYVFREVDRVLVRGKLEPIRLHELLGRHAEISPRVQEQLALYEQAQTAYHQRRFDEALGLFERCATEYQDSVASVYADRCRRFLVSAPAEDWTGVFEVGGGEV